jgi:polyribonucleotide nucleotidyltransferase
VNIPNGHRYTTTLGGRAGPRDRQVRQAGPRQRHGALRRHRGARHGAHGRPRVADGFLPLTVEYEERHYAVGKIPGSFLRREGRPGNQATLNARLIDRQIRPLFPKGLRRELQVIVTVLSSDQRNDPAMAAAIGASAALSISDAPWDGPTACARSATSTAATCSTRRSTNSTTA